MIRQFSGSDFRHLANPQRKLYYPNFPGRKPGFRVRRVRGVSLSCYVYCLYSTADGVPRYVGRASDKVSYRFKQHVTAALEKEPGALYDWMRDAYRDDHDIGFYTLQEGIVPKDVDMFERYWIGQFANLLNVVGNKKGTKDSAVGRQVKAAIQEQLKSARSVPAE